MRLVTFQKQAIPPACWKSSTKLLYVVSVGLTFASFFFFFFCALKMNETNRDSNLSPRVLSGRGSISGSLSLLEIVEGRPYIAKEFFKSC
jgi:hypothetical protein